MTPTCKGEKNAILPKPASMAMVAYDNTNVNRNGDRMYRPKIEIALGCSTYIVGALTLVALIDLFI